VLSSLVGRRRHQTGRASAEDADERPITSESTFDERGLERLPEELRLQLDLRSIPRLQVRPSALAAMLLPFLSLTHTHSRAYDTHSGSLRRAFADCSYDQLHQTGYPTRSGIA
jgi:hypothetical protein